MIGKDTGVFTIHDAVPSLRPTSEYSITSNDNKTYVITWYDGNAETEPTQSEINAEIIRLQEEWDTQEYARKRAQEYPKLAEQLDLLWHAIDTDTLDDKDYRNKFYTRLKKVKDDNPKG